MLHTLRFLLIQLVWLTVTANASASAYDIEREVYQLAEQALEQNDNKSYKKLYQQLKKAQYPLLGYLDYQAIQKEFSPSSQKAVNAFLTQHQNQYISQRMQASWLIYLAKNKHWQLFSDYDLGAFQSDRFQCWRISAKAQQANSEKDTLLLSKKLWLDNGHSLPKACDPWLEHFQQSSLFSSDIAFTRFQLAFSQKNTRLARYLRKSLNDEHLALANKMLNSPSHQEFWLQPAEKTLKSISSAAFKTVLEQLLNSDSKATIAALNAKTLASLDAADRIRIQRLSAWYLAKDSGKQALHWLSLQENNLDPELLEQQLRFSLQDKLWPEFINWYQKSPVAMQQSAEWRYWYSQALIFEKDTKQANAILLALAQERHFYGFLAAESLGIPAHIFAKDSKPQSLEVSTEVIQKLTAATELYHLGKIALANREFYFSSRGFTPEQWLEAGMLTNSIQWHSQAIRALARAKAFDAIEQRFPMAFIESFTEHGQSAALEPSWLLSMARQESGFLRQAQSHKGAKGVLQLMPQTAKQLMRKHNISGASLFDADHNIQLASLYLKDMLERFKGNYILATAAYNAGPNKVEEWLQERPIDGDWQHWVANIPYQETRQYVQHIISYSHIYQNQLRPDNLELSLLANKPATLN